MSPLKYLVAALASSAATSAAARPYLAFVQSQVSMIDAAYKPCTTVLGKSPCDTASSLAAVHALLYEITGAADSLSRVSALLLEYVVSWRVATSNGTHPNADQWDFFACHPGAIASRVLLSDAPGARTGWLPTDLADLETALGQVCSPQMYGVFNQPASRAAGVALFAQLFPRSDPRGELRAYAAAVWEDWVGTHAYPEDSPDYNSIYLRELYDLGETLSPAALAADMATPATRATLERALALVGPSGVAFAFGDAWGSAGGSGYSTDVRPWVVEELYYWPVVFERAAVAYGDGAFAGAALHSFALAAAAAAAAAPKAAPEPLVGLQALLLAHVAAAGGGPAPEAPADAGAGVAMRAMPDGPRGAGVLRPDKLLLYATRQPCANASYAATELLASNFYHAHGQQTGALVLYSAGGVTFLHTTGRDNRLPAAASMMLLSAPPGASQPQYPFRAVADQGLLPGGPFLRLDLPTTHMQRTSLHPADAWAVNLSSLHFYVSAPLPRGATATLRLAHIALVAPDGTTERVLDTFDPAQGAAPWAPRGAALVRDSALPPGAGAYAQALNCSGRCTFSRPANATPPLPGLLDPRDWPWLRVYARLEGPVVLNASADANFLQIGTGPYYSNPGAAPSSMDHTFDWSSEGLEGGRPVPPSSDLPYDVESLSPTFFTNTTSAGASRDTRDSCGAFSTRGYVSPGVVWSRAQLLLEEGPLVVVDTLALSSGDPAGLRTGGPSFALQVQGDADVGPGYIDAVGFNATGGCAATLGGAPSPTDRSSARLLLWFAAFDAAGSPVELHVGAQRAQLVSTFPLAAFARTVEALAVHAPLTFVTVLAPHDPQWPAAGLAAGARAHAAPNGTVTACVPLAPLGGSGAPGYAAVRIEPRAGCAEGSWAIVRGASTGCGM